MSNPPAPDQDPLALNPEVGLMFTAADHLIPLFRSHAIGTSLARQMAISAIDAYQPESPADYVNVARTIAFSMAALALLGQSAAQDMTMTQKMRALGRATALNRSADQSERTMMQRRRYQLANPLVEPNATAAQAAPKQEEIDEARMHAAIAEAMNEYQATQPATEPDITAKSTASMPQTRPAATEPKVASAPSMPRSSQTFDTPRAPASAIHPVQTPSGVSSGPKSYKDTLLHQGPRFPTTDAPIVRQRPAG